MIYILTISMSLVVALNIFMFIKNSSLSTTLNDSSNIRNTIIELDNFKTTITDMSNSQEIFLMTGNSKYKDDYNNYLNNSYTSTDSLLNNNMISNDDKTTLDGLINDYNSINESMLNETISYPATSEFESKIINSNNAKLKILHTVSNIISSHRDSLEDSSNSISNSLKNQKSTVNWISSIFTALLALPTLFSKKLLKESSNIANNINSIISDNSSKSDSNTDNTNTPPSIVTLEKFFNFENNVESLKEVREQLIENAVLINYIHISSFNSSTISDKCQLYSNELNSIINEFSSIEKIYSNDLSKESLDMYSRITNLKAALINLSIHLSQLNDYNNYIIKINDILINKEPYK